MSMTTYLEAPDIWMANGITVWLVGTGGNGGEVLDALAQFSTALEALGGQPLNVIAMDDAQVREVNLVRQRFWASDVGQNKAICLVNRYNMLLGTAWQGLPLRIEDALEIGVQRPDLIISAVDLPSVRRWISQEKAFKSRIWLDLGNGSRNGQAVLGVIGDDDYPTVEKHYPELSEMADDTSKSCSTAEAIASQDCLVNRAIATAGMSVLWELIRTGKTDKNGVVVDLKTAMQMPIPFPEKEAVQAA
jgi:PRTRC genetic system ThiF family protein